MAKSSKSKKPAVKNMSIEDIRDEINSLSRIRRRGIYKTGKMLRKVKKELPHGEFIPWVKNNCPFSYQSGSNYMRVSTVFKSSEIKYFSTKSLILLARKSTPEDIRKEIISEAKEGVVIPDKEIRERLKIDGSKSTEEAQTSDAESLKALRATQNISFFGIAVDALIKTTQQFEWSSELTDEERDKLKNIKDMLFEGVNECFSNI